MNHNVFDTLAAGYALGALDGQDLTDFEAHLAAGCARCTATLRDHAEALADLARSAPPAAPPARVREAPRGGRLRWAVATAAAVVAAAALTGAYVAARYEARLGQMAREAYALRQRLEKHEATLRDQLAIYAGAVDLLRDPATQVIALRGLGPSARATGRLIWNERSGGHLFVANLAPAPPGMTWELWTTAAAVPRPAGVFQVDASGKGSHRVTAVPGGTPVTVFAVTLEPEGGSPAPTGPMALASR